MSTELTTNLIVFYIFLGTFTGIFSSTLGVGGGVILVPALSLATILSQKEAQGVSLAVMIPMAIIATIRYQMNPDINIDWRAVAFIGVAMAIGAYFGSSLVGVLSNKTLKIMFACLLFVAGFRMIWVAVKG